ASAFATRRLQGSLQADLALGRSQLLSLGLDWLRDEVEATTPFDVDRRADRGVFVQWQGGFGAHALQGSLRHDDDDQFGGKTTGSLLWGWDLSRTLRLTASYGTAYRAPSFNELYYPASGNAGLEPESSRSVELGLRGRYRWGGWTLNAFRTEVDDMIVYDPTLVDAAHPFGQPDNIGRARIRGLEASGDVLLAGWTLQGTLTWLDPRDASGDLHDGNLLARR